MQAHWTRWPPEYWSSGSTKPPDYSPISLTPPRPTRPLSGWGITQPLTMPTARSFEHGMPTLSPPKTSIGPESTIAVKFNRYLQLFLPSKSMEYERISVSANWRLSTSQRVMSQSIVSMYQQSDG